MVEQAQLRASQPPEETSSDGRSKVGDVAVVAVGAAAGLAILGAPVAATLAAGVIGPIALEALKALRRRDSKAH
jgi:hypothetical protein